MKVFQNQIQHPKFEIQKMQNAYVMDINVNTFKAEQVKCELLYLGTRKISDEQGVIYRYNFNLCAISKTKNNLCYYHISELD